MIDQKLAVCVVGAGRAGMIHAMNFRQEVPNTLLAAIVDPDEQAVKSAAHQLGINRCYSDYKNALEDDRIDAYIVVSPTQYHMQAAIDIAGCKKHILCEKPMGMTEEECDRMIMAAEQNDVILQIGFMRRFDDAFVRAKQMIEWGEIGDVVMVRSNTRGPSVPKPWMYDLKKSNGPLAEVNSHDIDTMRWFTGSEFQTVYAVGGNYRCPDAREQFPDFYDNVVLAGFRHSLPVLPFFRPGLSQRAPCMTKYIQQMPCLHFDMPVRKDFSSFSPKGRYRSFSQKNRRQSVPPAYLPVRYNLLFR